MITFSRRPMTTDEKKRLTKGESLYKVIERFIMILAGVFLMLDIPLLIFDHYSPVSSHVQGIYCIIMVAIGLAVAGWATNKARASTYTRISRIQSSRLPDYLERILLSILNY